MFTLMLSVSLLGAGLSTTIGGSTSAGIVIVVVGVILFVVAMIVYPKRKFKQK